MVASHIAHLIISPSGFYMHQSFQSTKKTGTMTNTFTLSLYNDTPSKCLEVTANCLIKLEIEKLELSYKEFSK